MRVKILLLTNYDASGLGFGAVLHQDSAPITFYSHPVVLQNAELAAYERELIGLVKAVRHWQPYLWARPFVVRTDHHALKFLLDQCLSTILRHTWVNKLFGYDFTLSSTPARRTRWRTRYLAATRTQQTSMPPRHQHSRSSMRFGRRQSHCRRSRRRAS
jgi:hypothetical protein